MNAGVHLGLWLWVGLSFQLLTHGTDILCPGSAERCHVIMVNLTAAALDVIGDVMVETVRIRRLPVVGCQALLTYKVCSLLDSLPLQSLAHVAHSIPVLPERSQTVSVQSAAAARNNLVMYVHIVELHTLGVLLSTVTTDIMG